MQFLIRIFILVVLGLLSASAADSEGTLLKGGDVAPSLVATTTDNQQISIASQTGKLVLVNLFATWCPPCMQEIPRLEVDLWQKFKDRGLVIVALGREHSMEEMAKFKSDRHFTFSIAADPKREIYSKFATNFIPRNYLIGKNGRIIFTSVGYRQAEFESMVKLIEMELGK